MTNGIDSKKHLSFIEQIRVLHIKRTNKKTKSKIFSPTSTQVTAELGQEALFSANSITYPHPHQPTSYVPRKVYWALKKLVPL